MTAPPLRYQRTDACVGCGECADRTFCAPVRAPLRKYDGVRFTSDGFDCALPVTIDSHSHCSYECLYCFSDNMTNRRALTAKTVGQTPLREIEKLFSGEGRARAYDIYREALHYGARRNGYPCPVQLGGLCDPCDNIERQQGWLLGFIDLAVKYRQPVRMSTKGRIFLLKEYQRAIARNPELFWVAFSIISPDDELMRLVDARAPSVKQRLKTMKALTTLGVRASLRFRPIFPGISDATPRYPQAYKTLINMAAEAGATAISYETGFVAGAAPAQLRDRWMQFERLIGVPITKIYRTFGPHQACIRPAYAWTEGIMHAIKEEAVKCGLAVGVSDPVWKQLTECGCCCGIKPTDPVFGNWQRENATNALLTARKSGKEITFDQVVPPWAVKVPKVDVCAYPAGPLKRYDRYHDTWADDYARKWDDLKTERSALNYFQGAIRPVRRAADGHLVYNYVGLKRLNLKGLYWSV